MHLETKNAERLLEATQKKFSDDGIGKFIDSASLNSYKQFLENIANERQYKEGERIMPSDLKRINRTVKKNS